MSATEASVDCLIVGAGPAGLTAATYLRRFRRTVVLLDGGESRARWIPRSHNCPGFPLGVSGDSLLARLQEQAADVGAQTIRTRATRIARHPDGFEAGDDHGRTWLARQVILATGVVDVMTQVAGARDAVDRGVIRICAICDGLEATDRDIVVYGPAAEAVPHAQFLRTYSASVSVLPDTDERIDADVLCNAADIGIEVLPACRQLHFDEAACRVGLADGNERRFDALYPVLGAVSRNDLALQLGAEVDDEGALQVDARQHTSVHGLYAIGDLVSGLNQIAVAVGHVAIAATAVHNALPRNPR